jgi:N-acetylmuramoyl-L-alanine amidase
MTYHGRLLRTLRKVVCVGALAGLLCASPASAAARVDVVIDPGHGGSNTGSPGRGEVLEKRVTLALAKAVSKRLAAAGVAVQLTRTRDVYVPIRARARVANALMPRCFVSLHTNASFDHARQGAETYLLSRDAIDIRAHQAGRVAGDDAAGVLADLQALATARASLHLAELVQRQLVAPGAGYAPADRGVRQAAHDVLADAEVPAVLVEVGFLDHPIEGRVLASAEGQDAIAERLAAAILAFVRATDNDAGVLSRR